MIYRFLFECVKGPEDCERKWGLGRLDLLVIRFVPEKETMLDLNKDNTSRKRERARSQKIRRAVKRHEERVNTPKGRSNNPSRRKPKKTAGDQGARNKHR